MKALISHIAHICFYVPTMYVGVCHINHQLIWIEAIANIYLCMWFAILSITISMLLGCTENNKIDFHLQTSLWFDFSNIIIWEDLISKPINHFLRQLVNALWTSFSYAWTQVSWHSYNFSLLNYYTFAKKLCLRNILFNKLINKHSQHLSCTRML